MHTLSSNHQLRTRNLVMTSTATGCCSFKRATRQASQAQVGTKPLQSEVILQTQVIAAETAGPLQSGQQESDEPRALLGEGEQLTHLAIDRELARQWSWPDRWALWWGTSAMKTLMLSCVWCDMDMRRSSLRSIGMMDFESALRHL